MSYESDGRYVQGVIFGAIDALGDDVLTHLVVLQAKYRALQDAGMGAILGRAFDTRSRALASVREAEDRAYLEALLAGTEDMLAPTVSERIEPMFDYGEGTEMLALVEKVADAYGEAVQKFSAWVLAGYFIEQAQHGKSNEP